MWCYAYITLFVAVLGRTEPIKQRTFSLNFGGQKAFTWEMNDPLRGVSRLVSGNTEPVDRTTETITTVYTTNKGPIETTINTLAQPTIETKPTIDYSNRKPVEEEKFKKVHAFVLCVVQDGYNCGKELGDIDIIKHLGPPPNVTDENYNNSQLNTSEITEKPSIENEQNTFQIITDFIPDETTTFSPENVTTTVQESLKKATRTYEGTLKTRKKTTLMINEQGTTDVPLLETVISNEDPELPQTITAETQTIIPSYIKQNTFPEENPSTIPTFQYTTEKDGIFPDYKSSFGQLQIRTLNLSQADISKFLPPSWIEYDSVLHNHPYSTTPQPQASFVTVTTTRTTRDVNQEHNDTPSTTDGQEEKQSHKNDSENESNIPDEEDKDGESNIPVEDDKDAESNIPDEDKDEEIEPVSETDDQNDGTKIVVPSVEEFNFTEDNDENKTTTEEIKPEEEEEIKNNSNDTYSETNDKDDKTTTEDGNKDIDEENSDKYSSEIEKDKTEKEDKTDDDKSTTTEKFNDFTSGMDDLDRFTINIEPIEFDDDFDDTMLASSSDRIMNKASDETSATVPVIIYASPSGATNFSTNALEISNNTYEFIGTTSTEISVVTEVSVQRNPKQNTNSSKDSETIFTKAKNSLYSIWKFAKELDVN